MPFSKEWIFSQLDVNNVFVNSDLKELVYMIQLEGFEVQSSVSMVYKLKKDSL